MINSGNTVPACYFSQCNLEINMQFSTQHRFSIFYFFLTGYFAIPLVFLPLLCHARGFSAEQIAIVGIASTLCSCIGGPFFLHLTAEYIPARVVAKTALFLCALFFSLLFFIESFIFFLGVWFVHHFFFKATAIIDARAIRLSIEHTITFEIVRTWGSIGFIIISFFIGLSLSTFGSIASIFIGTAFLLLPALCFKLVEDNFADSITGKKNTAPAPLCSAEPLLKIGIACLLGINLINWFSHAPLYLYFSIYLKELGWSGTTISFAWTVGVLSEILMFLTIPRICTRPAHYATMLTGASILAAIRWWILSITSVPAIILSTQILHAFSFGAVYIASMKLIYYLLPDRYRDRGQGYIQAAGLGGGTLLGNIYFGYRASSLDSYRELPELFNTAALIVLCCIPLSMIIKRQLSTTRQPE